VYSTQDAEGRSHVFLVRSDGTGLRELPTGGEERSPAFSPDGEWLAYHSACQLKVAPLEGPEAMVIWEREGACVHDPQWSPDGQWLVFSVMPQGPLEFPVAREIWVASREGAEAWMLTVTEHPNGECLDLGAFFSPDGRQVAYQDGACSSWLIEMDGAGAPKPLDVFPEWWSGAFYPPWAGLAAPAPEGCMAKANQTFLVHEGPSFAAPTVERMARDDVRAVIGYATDPDGARWYEFEGGGWAVASVLRLDGPCDDLPLRELAAP
jgi:hypothetical protein